MDPPNAKLSAPAPPSVRATMFPRSTSGTGASAMRAVISIVGAFRVAPSARARTVTPIWFSEIAAPMAAVLAPAPLPEIARILESSLARTSASEVALKSAPCPARASMRLVIEFRE